MMLALTPYQALPNLSRLQHQGILLMLFLSIIQHPILKLVDLLHLALLINLSQCLYGSDLIHCPEQSFSFQTTQQVLLGA